MNAADLTIDQRWKTLELMLQNRVITLAPWHGSYVSQFQQANGLIETNSAEDIVQFQLPNLGETIMKSYMTGSQNQRDISLKRTPFLLRDTENGEDYSMMLDIRQGRLSTPSMMAFMQENADSDEIGLADAFYCEMMHTMRNLIFGKTGSFYGALIPAVTLSQVNTHNEAWLKAFEPDPDFNIRKYVPETNGRGLQAVLLRAAEIVAHPNYNEAVATCAGNGLHMLSPHNWHLPAIVMALRSFPIPCAAETLLDKKNYAGLLMTYGDAFRDVPGNEIPQRAAEALANLSPTRTSRGKKMVSEILTEGFHISILGDILRVDPTEQLPENSMEEAIFRLSSGAPRPEGLYTNGDNLMKSIVELSKTCGVRLLSEITILDSSNNILQGEHTEELRIMVEASNKVLRQMTPEEASNSRFEINENLVDSFGIYTGPLLNNYNGDLHVNVPCYYPDKNGITLVSGNLILKDGAGGPYLEKKHEKGTILTVNGPLKVGGIASKSEESLGSKNFTLVCAESLRCAGKAELFSGNIKTTKGSIQAQTIDAGVVHSASHISCKEGIYANLIAVTGQIRAKEIHSDWIQGKGEAYVENNITLLYGSVFDGPVRCQQISILNPRRNDKGGIKPTLIATSIRTDKIEPAGVFLPLDGLENPAHAMKGNSRNSPTSQRMMI